MNNPLNPSLSTFRLFAVSPPGLEQVTLHELNQMGVRNIKFETGGINFVANIQELYRANLWLRSVNRVLLRIGRFNVKDFDELEDQISRYPWGIYLPSGGVVRVNVSTHKSRLYHSGAIEERAVKAIQRRIGKDVASWRLARKSNVDVNLFVLVRILNDFCEISIDTSGKDLYKRGYKKDSGRASIRENLAFAVLMAAGWDGKSTVLDPMCGSGTIIIEAAMHAASIAPGLYRHFAFETWTNFSPDLWQNLRNEAKHKRLSTRTLVPSFFASDHDAEALNNLRNNAQRAGVADMIQVSKKSVARLERPADVEHGWIISNPPYGRRIKQKNDISGLYSTLGRIIREQFSGWNVGIVCPDYKLQRSLALPLKKVCSFKNGGNSVELISSEKGLLPLTIKKDRYRAKIKKESV